jgi:hypothetical protein
VGLERNQLSVRRLRIVEPVHLGSWVELTTRLGDVLPKRAFSGLWTRNVTELTGWVRPDDPISTELAADLNAWQCSPVAWLCWRSDERKVQAALLRARLRTACEEWQLSNRANKVPASVKREFKDQIIEELLERTQPKMRTFGLAVDLQERMIYVASTADSRVDALRRQLHRQLGWKFLVDSPYHWLPEPDPVVDRLGTGTDELGATFLLWLWKHHDAILDLEVEGTTCPVSWNVGDQVELARRGNEGPERWSARHIEGLCHHAVARQALVGGYMPTSLNLEIGVCDLVFDLRLKAPDCQIQALRGQPNPDEFGDDNPLMAAVWARVGNLRTLYAALEALFSHFATEVLEERFSVAMARAWAREELL